MSNPAPVDEQIWDAADAGAYLRVSARTVTERYSVMPGFPQHFRLPSAKGRGRLRWWARDIINWVKEQTP